MSKLFFDGRIDKRENHGNNSFTIKQKAKPGSADHPLTITVATEQRKAEIETILKENALHAKIIINADEENTIELDTVLKKPQTITIEKTPGRNDACSCGSGKKFKKCCGK